MHLHDTLQVCLLALESRYPHHIVNLNETVPEFQDLEVEGCTSQGLIQLLEQLRPELLQATAYLVIDPQKSEIFLTQFSEQVPAFVIHCRGKIRPCKGEEQMHLYDTLQVCLLALESRYPYHIVDLNKAVPEFQDLEVEECTSQGLMKVLEQLRPELLQKTAYLAIDPQRSEIFLTQFSEQIPAFVIHCRGKIRSL